MINVTNLTKEFKIYKKQPGLKGMLKSLVSKEFEIKKAVNNISFHISEGEIVGYIGSNGAGKSTTIKMMTGILVPTSGNCTVNNIVPYKKRQMNAKNIGVVFGQKTQLWWDLPLSETFSILKDIYNVDDASYKKRMNFLNEVLDLKDFSRNPVRTLSLGQRMRADLAASLIHNPKILYLDEPTIGLDVMVKEKIRDSIKVINEEFKTTVILTTHDLTDIEELCNRIIIIDKGEKIYDGGLEKIKHEFGYMRTLKIDLKNVKAFEKYDLNTIFNLNEDIEHWWIDGNSCFIECDKNKTNISDIICHFSKNLQVQDISIKETAIEDIIKKIYRSEVNL